MLKGLSNGVALAVLGLALSGCHAFRHIYHNCEADTDGYRQATTIAPLRVPLGIDPPDTKSSLQIPVLDEPPLPPRGANDPCLDEPPKFTEPKGPRPPPAV
ncbi:MAG TPA: hypothetical protein VK696_00170 [Steroidobacteraceae bacterium]|jgi:hypothetical protein|nr:hypothetical protein [Steroidobacteraceae bacterium]